MADSRQALPIRVRRQVIEASGSRCYYCGKVLPGPGPDAQVDHKEPASRGGSDEPSNLRGACGSCNASKAGMPLSQYREYIVRRSVPWQAVEALSVLFAAHRELGELPGWWLLMRLAAVGKRYRFPGELREAMQRRELPESAREAWAVEAREAIELVSLKPRRRGGWGRGRHGR